MDLYTGDLHRDLSSKERNCLIFHLKCESSSRAGWTCRPSNKRLAFQQAGVTVEPHHYVTARVPASFTTTIADYIISWQVVQLASLHWTMKTRCYANSDFKLRWKSFNWPCGSWKSLPRPDKSRFNCSLTKCRCSSGTSLSGLSRASALNRLSNCLRGKAACEGVQGNWKSHRDSMERFGPSPPELKRTFHRLNYWIFIHWSNR